MVRILGNPEVDPGGPEVGLWEIAIDVREGRLPISLAPGFPSPAAVLRSRRPHQTPGVKLSHANYNRSPPACARVSSTTDSPSLSHHRNSIEFA
jgi:hypothetical protein